MITTANLIELNKLVGGEHDDPHHILGMHEARVKNEKLLVVRAFVPQAAQIDVLDARNETLVYPMKKIHVEGFYEAVIPKRQEFFDYKLTCTDINGHSWTYVDPYSFGPVITDLDRHLFGEGTHYAIFEKLGAHVQTIGGVDGVRFAVWAPNARRVSVIGDFNSWDGRRHAMRHFAQSGIWELFIPGLVPNDRYKFELITKRGERYEKSDPFGFFHELRPSQASLVYDIDRYEWHDGEWLQNRAAVHPLDRPMNIYEVHLGSWRRVEEDGNRFMSYTEAADALIPYVKEMGYTHIELMPVEEHPFDGSWGYQVTGYYAPTSRYGSPSEYMTFVDKCHQNGIGVIMDWVPAHFPKDGFGLARFDGSCLFEHENPVQAEHPEWGTLIFNYGRNEVKNFLIANAIYWLEKYHIDGLRVDAVASMLYLNYARYSSPWIPNRYGGNINLEAVEFIKHMNSVILGRMPHALMIAEESTSWGGVSRPVEQGGLGFNLKWNMGWMNDMLYYMKQDPIHRKYEHNKLTFGIMYACTENFVLVLSHDEVVHGKLSLLNKMPGDYWQKFANLRLFLGFMMGHPGKKLLFMGGEFGQFIEWDEKASLDWFLLDYEKHRDMKRFVKDLNHLYLEEKSMWFDDFNGTGFEWINCDDRDRSLISFFRKSDKANDITLFICNFTPVVHRDFRVGVPAGGVYAEVLNSDATEYGGSGVLNESRVAAEPVAWDGRAQSIVVDIPPLATIVLKLKANAGKKKV